jgi:hypothetical protein
MKTRLHLIIILVAGAAAVAISIYLKPNPPDETRPQSDKIHDPPDDTLVLGDKFYDPQMKLTFHPPAGWKPATPEQEVQKLFSRPDCRLLAHFKGPKPGDSCNILVYASDDRRIIQLSREETSRRDPTHNIKSLEFSFDKINGVPAWINQYASGSPPFVLHNIQVVLDRSDKKILLLFAASARSMREQQQAVHASVRSIQLD